MNAFMVFSAHERRRVVAEQPDIQNTQLSKELGRRWNGLSAADRQPFVAEAERLRVLHSREYPGYKYRPAKKRVRPAATAARQNQDPAPGIQRAGGVGGLGALSRISISQGQRGVLRSINTNKLQHRVTIDRKFKAALRRANSGLSKPSQGFVSLGRTNTCSGSPDPSSPLRSSSVIPDPGEGVWTSVRLSQSVPTSPEVPAASAYDLHTVPSSSCPNTPLAPSGLRALASGWREADTSSLPDLSEMFSSSLDSDLRLDWADDQLENLNLNLNLNNEDLDFADQQWFNKEIFSNIF